MGESHTIAEFATTTTFDDVPAARVEAAKRAIRDYVGVALYGSRHRVGERISSYVDRCLPGSDAAVLGRERAEAGASAIADLEADGVFDRLLENATAGGGAT